MKLKEEDRSLTSNNVPKESFGLVRKTDNVSGDDPSWIASKLEKTESQIDLSLNEIILSDEVAELFTVPELVGLLESACNLANLADYMKKMTPLISPVLIPFMSSVSDVILNIC